MIFALRAEHLLFIACCLSTLSLSALAAETSAPTELPRPSSDPIMPVPRDRDYPWMALAQWQGRHTELSAIAAKGEAKLIFLGDSITALTQGSESWGKTFEAYNFANFGIGGDRTQNVLWRLEHGEIGALKPKVVVLLIGTNNIGTTEHDTEDTVRGVTAVVQKLRAAFPKTKILVLGDRK